MKVAVVTIALGFLTLPAYAAPLRGSDIQITCNWLPAGTMTGGPNTEVDCERLVIGEVDSALARMRSRPAALICMPPRVNNRKLVAIVESYVYQHPGEMNAYAGVIVSSALIQAFPCR